MMRVLGSTAAAWMGLGLALAIAGCGGGGTTGGSGGGSTTYTLTVDSTNPASGVAITVSPADVNSAANGSTSFTRTYDSGTSVTLTAPGTSGGNNFSAWTGCTSTSGDTCTVTMSGNKTATASYTSPTATTYTLTVDSINPTASSVAITATPADNNGKTTGNTSYTLTYDAGTLVTLAAPSTAGGGGFTAWTGGCTIDSGESCSVALNANTTVTANYSAPVATYTLTVDSTNPTSGVAITVSPADINSATNGSTSFTRTYDSGASVTLTAPATSGSNAFSSWTGCTSASTETCSVTLNADTTVTDNYTASSPTAPTITITPPSGSLYITAPQSVGITVNGSPTPTGSVKLTSGSYTSAATTLASGSASIVIPANTLTAGTDSFNVAYTPDTNGALNYTATSVNSSLAMTASSAVAVDQASDVATATDQILGMNLAAWYDVVSNKTAIVNAFAPATVSGSNLAGGAGIAAVRWPGGSWSDVYHWQTNTNCQNGPYGGGTPSSDDTFSNFVTDIVKPANLDLALTADYGTNAACTGGGEPSEAAAWVTAATADGVNVSHMTVGNEEYGSTWEEDLHSSPNNPTTYAAAVAGSSGYYASIKAANSTTLVGVDAEADNTVGGWDDTVFANAKGYYDFVEYHYYPQGPGSESDTYLVHTAAQGLTTNLNTLKSELRNYGTANTPIYVGEIGSVYTNPGKQSWSITQGLYAGQLLGEMMNDGVARATWWIGFGNCNGSAGNDSASLYGWQSFGAYNVFSDGPTEDPTCPGGPLGTMSPTARAFQLFSNVAVTGETVLSAGVTGDTTDVRAYAATHSGGTALVLFNDNETTSEPVTITLSAQTTATSVTVETYNKALYDQTDATTPVWAAPTVTSMGTQSLPLTLVLTPWSMNVVIIQ